MISRDADYVAEVRDFITGGIADELRRRFAEYDDVPASVREFLETAGPAR